MNDKSITERVYARIGLLGNPSDSYYGKTISLSLANFFAEVPHYGGQLVLLLLRYSEFSSALQHSVKKHQAESVPAMHAGDTEAL